ncbi:hypothetical protein LTS16_004161 [Friedmanniomyces endolithicus]|uniref:Fungal N-terminal domain-containing protein n=1 Tax=Friedmanniomyces endolithicus TaxID=329885 RepID=A0AAN6FWM5_9PEZI|nr:hypothetical protein LTR35_001089 [Friedmanniomyces endolithicus]KAK0296665.1 hypothetical protein LTS00_004991 [Friedmanniomyces endolithicus]KAK0324813.1 hypothetical protein LTR82_004519 [Friedmanniomyces endolithicus]KAK1018766.1 hypothetical protein LTR54_001654 [Friedmanniomyces endolithicus]KAK1048689.1 hypothetical protein LTS16_004161 [Friedmanniomyces endolithicus]
MVAISPLSVGDILMLSQTAWKIGRAFRQGQANAVTEFAEVEREADGLSEALKLVAEALHTDGGMLSRADEDTKTAVNSIMESAHTTLSDLESFVERYQVIKKRNTRGGVVVERSWNEVVVANYRTFKWTTEGGSIVELRNMLQMHSNSINLVMQALQSRSLARLEKTVTPMAENIADIHERVNGDLGAKIDDLHRIIMAVASSTPSLQARDRAIEDGGPSRHGSVNTVATSELAGSTGTRALEPPPLRVNPYGLPVRQPVRRGSTQSSESSKSTVLAARSAREDSAYWSMGPLPFERESRRADWNSESGSPPENRRSIGDGFPVPSSPQSPADRRTSHVARRESSTLPNLLNALCDSDAVAGSSERSFPTEESPTMRTPDTSSSRASSSRNPHNASILPPPALPPDGANSPPSAATPSSFLSSPTRQRSNLANLRDAARPTPASSVRRPNRNSTASDPPASPPALEAPSFEKLLFRNAAILCDVRGTLVEYAQSRPDEPDPRFNTEMLPACTSSRICVIRKRENREHGGTRVVASIWTLAEDGGVRLQQKLSEVNETVPYCSYFDPLKVSLPPSEGPGSEIALRFHSEAWGEEEAVVRTNWVNYVFATEGDAAQFQSAVFGRTLLGSFHTTKTTVLHEGFKGAFAFEEQFANIEMLRLWEDDGISTPGAAGGVLALLHVSSSFGEGWARWWINSSRLQVRVKEDGVKGAKVKGIDVMVVKPGSGADKMRGGGGGGAAASGGAAVGVGEGGLQRVETLAGPRPNGGKRIPVRAVTGVKVEFKAEEDKRRFVAQCRRVQEKMLLLPDL